MVAALTEALGPWLLRYERLTHHPTRIGNVCVLVQGEGAVYLRHNRVAPTGEALWTDDEPGQHCGHLAEPERWLHALLQGRGFFTWPLLARDGDRPGGICETLEWTGEGARTLVRDRVQDGEFHELVNHLLWQLQVMPALLA